MKSLNKILLSFVAVGSLTACSASLPELIQPEIRTSLVRERLAKEEQPVIGNIDYNIEKRVFDCREASNGIKLGGFDMIVLFYTSSNPYSAVAYRIKDVVMLYDPFEPKSNTHPFGYFDGPTDQFFVDSNLDGNFDFDETAHYDYSDHEKSLCFVFEHLNDYTVVD